MSKIETKLAEHDASIETLMGHMKRLLACPQVMHLLESHEANERARELAIAEDQRRAADRAKEDASLRRGCESEDGRWRSLVTAPQGPGCVAVDLDLGTLGKRRLAPGAVIKNMRNLELKDLLKRDRVLAELVQAREVTVEDIEIERAIRLERADRAQIR